jgi:hypothetical protein
MFFKKLLLPFLLVALCDANLRIARPICDTPGPTQEQINLSKKFIESERSRITQRALREVKVDTHIHIIATSRLQEDGYVTVSLPVLPVAWRCPREADTQKQKKVDDQFAVITEAFAPHGISFNLVNVTWIVDAHWAMGDDEEKLKFKRVLRQGNYSTLNLYFLKKTKAGKTIGHCTAPEEPAPSHGSRDFYQDGCTMMTSTMPGGSATGVNLGLTAVHEVSSPVALLTRVVLF